ncbi:MAG: type II toxin-antitoxin system RelE/ParE family toxin [Rhodothermaceae bacterium]|nr:type II toxin-antitoxin system RelE/ParE family toxin [Rhodothermaceae bacterium]
MSGIARKRIVEAYVDEQGKTPVREWIEELKDAKARVRIKHRIAKLKEGLLGDYKFIGEGVWELRIHLRPGYRVYFAEVDQSLLLLLCGGTKKTQHKDIKQAKYFLEQYIRRTDHEKD